MKQFLDWRNGFVVIFFGLSVMTFINIQLYVYRDTKLLSNLRLYESEQQFEKEDVNIRNTFDSENKCWFSTAAELQVDCKRLFRNDNLYLARLKSNKTKISPNVCDLKSLSIDCSKLKEFHGYWNWKVTPEEREFPLAFSIKMHKAANQAEQLLRTIWRPHNVYCIHVDKKAKPDVFQIMSSIGSCFDNIFVLEERLDVLYTSIDMMTTDLMCMEKLLKVNSLWKYYINFSGQEYVLKTNFEIVKILKMLNGANDIESYPLPSHDYGRFTYFYKRSPGLMVGTDIKNAPIPPPFNKSGMLLRKGSMYGSFTRKFVEFILSSNTSKNLIAWARNTYAPEEVVWPSLSALPEAPGNILQKSYSFISQGKNNFVSRAITWAWTKTHKCVGPYVRSICIYGIYELSWLVMQPNIAANKFNEDIDQLALDCLEESLNNRSVDANLDNFNWYYYYHLPHVYGRQ